MFLRKKDPCTEDSIVKTLLSVGDSGIEQVINCLYELCRPEILSWLRKAGWQYSNRRWLFRKPISKQDAEDTFQDAVIILLRKIKSGQFTLTTTPCKYLRAIAGWIQVKAGQRSRPTVDLEDDLLIQEDIERLVDWYYFLPKIVQACLSKLDKRCQDLITDYYIDGLTLTEMREKYGYASERVASEMISRCFKDLKKCAKSQSKN